MICKESPYTNFVHPYVTHINSLYRSYKDKYDFCSFYIQKLSEKIHAVIAVHYKTALIYADADSDFDELAEFVSYNKAIEFVHTNSFELSRSITGFNVVSGNSYVRRNKQCDFSSLLIDYEKSYQILRSAFDDVIELGSFDLWYCDMSHRYRKNTACVYCLDGKATASICGKDDKYAVIGQTAVSPQYRGQGLGSRILTLAGAASGSLYTAVDSQNTQTDEFYLKNGFKNSGNWFDLRRI